MKEDIIILEETIKSIEERLKIMCGVGTIGRNYDEKIYHEIQCKINPYIDRYIENLKVFTKLIDESLSQIENPYNEIASEFNQWK